MTFKLPSSVKLFQSLNGSSGKPLINVTGSWMSEKYDGVRALYLGNKVLVTCSGRQIDAPDSFYDHFPEGYLFDGELWISRNNFGTISGLVRKQASQSSTWTLVKYLVFDVLAYKAEQSSVINFLTDEPFEIRQKLLQRLFSITDKANAYEEDSLSKKIGEKEVNGSHIFLIPQFYIDSIEEFEKFNREIISLKGEGVVIVPPKSLYLGGQRNCYKMKEVEEIEAIVIGYNDGNGKNKGKVGSFLVLKVSSEGEIFSKCRFSIGVGLTQIHRDHGKRLFPLGTVVTCHYNGLSSNGIPRFPRLKGIRADIVIDESIYREYIV